jgi:hypothetical protein
MYNKKTLTFTFHHYWGAFCQGAFVLGGFCPGGFRPRPIYQLLLEFFDNYFLYRL